MSDKEWRTLSHNTTVYVDDTGKILAEVTGSHTLGFTYRGTKYVDRVSAQRAAEKEMEIPTYPNIEGF